MGVVEDLEEVAEGVEMKEAEGIGVDGDVEGVAGQGGITTEAAMKTGDDRTDITTEK